MTPAARIQAAIEILDQALSGQPVEQVLTTWGRRNRFAGSGDRAAIRDHVFDALRCRRSFAALGGSETGRGLMVGALRAAGTDPAQMFSGAPYAPAALGPEDLSAGRPWDALTETERLDCPDWLAGELRASLGAEFGPTMAALRHRAPVFLRVNLRRATPAQAIAALAEDGVLAVPHALAGTALEVTGAPRRVHRSRAFAEGLVELQDAASQAVVEALALPGQGARILDYCAGGGGKALAMAARADARVFAHDALEGRMADLPARAARAGVSIPTLRTADLAAAAPFDLVLCDVPCSGSGAWRRQPEAKWSLTAPRLAELQALQAEILDTARASVAPGGRLAYATCSLLARENADQIEAFLSRHPDWRCLSSRTWTPGAGGDGFGLAILTRIV